MQSRISFHHKRDLDSIVANHDNCKGQYWSSLDTGSAEVTFFYRTFTEAHDLADLLADFAAGVRHAAMSMAGEK